MHVLPLTTIAIKHNSLAILVGPHAGLIGGKLYRIAYYGYALDIALTRWERITTNAKFITSALPGKATIGLLQ